MRSTLRPALALFALTAGFSPAALAGANHIPAWSLDTPKDVEQAVKTFGFTTDGKAETWAKKIAIPAFVVRYDKKQADKDDGSWTTVQFKEDATYTAMTDALYDALVKRFTDAGFEVVPRSAVVAAASYRALEGAPGNDEGDERVRGIPSGMKDLGTQFGQPSHPDALAALNKELGTDAVVAVYANFGLCIVDRNASNPFSGTKPCLKGNVTLPGLSMLFVGGAKEAGAGVKPAWTSRAFKAVEAFTYQDGTGQHRDAQGNMVGDVPDISDAALISPLDLDGYHPDRLFTGIDSDGAALAQGVADMLDVAFTLAMETFYDKNADAMAAAGFARPAVAPAPATAKPLTAAQRAAKLADVQTQIQGAIARPDGAPAAGGVVRCYQMPAAGAQNETLLRRGMEPSRLVEESVSVVPGLGPVQNVATYTLGAGTFDAADGKGVWTGTGTFEGPADAWTSWKSTLQVKTGAKVDVTGTAEGTGLHIVTVVKGADGAVAATMDQHYGLLEPAACEAAWAAALAYKAPPIAAPPAKKGKK